MASAVTAIFGADATSFDRQLVRMENMVMASGRKMATVTAAGHMVGMTGIIRESAVIGREIAMGRGTGRILSSATLLAQYLNSAAAAAAKGVVPAKMLAAAYEQASFQANAAALAAIRKAEADLAAAEADGFEDDASIAAADASAIQAQQANLAAAAIAQKAQAAAADAVAQEADAAATTAGVGALGTIATVVAGIVATFALWHIRVGMLADRLSGLKAPDVFLEPIARQNHAINESDEAQRKLNDSIQETIDKYNSAEEVAKRFSAQLKMHTEHSKKILDLQKETALAKLGPGATSEQKMGIERDFEVRQLALQRQTDMAELQNLQREQYNLTNEGHAAGQAAGNIHVATTQEEQQKTSISKGKAEFADKFLKTQAEDPSLWENIKNQFAAGLNPGARDAVKEAGDMNAQTAREWIKQYKAQVQANADAAELREKQNKLREKEKSALGKAAEIGLQLPQKQKEISQTQADAADESAARLAQEQARNDAAKTSDKGYGLNAQQRLGGYAAMPPDFKRLTEAAVRTANNTAHLLPKPPAPPTPSRPQFSGHDLHWRESVAFRVSQM